MFDQTEIEYPEVKNRTRKISKKEKRKQLLDQEKLQKSSLNLKSIVPITPNQQKAFKCFHDGKHLMLHGTAGSGKSLISIFLALNSILVDRLYDKLIIVRSVVPTRDMGFLPGSQKEKTKVYEAPYISLCSEIFGRGDAYEILKNKGLIEFISTSFVRGITMKNSIMVVDEIQNLTYHEADSIITRAGKNCRIIFSGDVRQTDLNRGKDISGLKDFIKIIERMKSFISIEFGTEDICRSALVKEYIITRNKLEDNGTILPLSMS